MYNHCLFFHHFKVYTLDAANILRTFFGNELPNRVSQLEQIAEQVATLCTTLGEYPIIRYRA